MTLERAVTLFAGFMVLLSLALTRWVNPAWVWLTVFVGFNLMQSSITGFCPAAMVMRRLGLRPAGAPANPSVQAGAVPPRL